MTFSHTDSFANHAKFLGMKGNRKARAAAQASKASPLRWLFTAVMLAAFVLQSYAIQTHIHEQLTLPLPVKAQFVKAQFVKAEFAKAEQALTGAVGSAHIQKPGTPAKDAPDDCPLCQLLYGGQYVAPNALVLFLPLFAVRSIETELGILPHYDAVSHSWLGRAPPHA
jgi:hypothetical protein